MAQNRFTAHVNSLTGLTKTQHAVLRMFAQYTDNETGEGFPSLVTLAAGTLLARSTVQLAMEELQEKGYLEFVRKRKTQNFWVNVYRVVLPGTIPTHHSDECTIPTSHRTDHRTDPVSPHRREDSSNQQVDRTDTDRIGNELDQVCSLPKVDRIETAKPELISTDASSYVKRIVDRFARYKNPGKDAEQYAMEIFIDSGLGIGRNYDPAWEWKPGVSHGEVCCRHILDIIGFVFEIQINDPKFKYADRTHTMKNLRDHLLKEKSPLENCWMEFCTDWNGSRQGNPLRNTRGHISYAMQTVDDPEFCAWGAEVRKRIRESQQRMAKAG